MVLNVGRQGGRDGERLDRKMPRQYGRGAMTLMHRSRHSVGNRGGRIRARGLGLGQREGLVDHYTTRVGICPIGQSCTWLTLPRGRVG